MKTGLLRLAAATVALAGIGIPGCTSTGPDIPTLYGYLTAEIGGHAWQSRRQWPDPPVDSTVVAVYLASTGRVWISGYGNPPPGGGIVEELSLCVPSGAGQGRYALGPVGHGPFAFWVPADTSTSTVSHYYSGTPAGTLAITEYDPAGGTIRVVFNFEGHQDNGTRVLQVTGGFYGRLIEGVNTSIPATCR
jgi:hypothetical protein